MIIFMVLNFVTELLRWYCGQGHAIHNIWWWTSRSLCIF